MFGTKKIGIEILETKMFDTKNAGIKNFSIKRTGQYKSDIL